MQPADGKHRQIACGPKFFRGPANARNAIAVGTAWPAPYSAFESAEFFSLMPSAKLSVFPAFHKIAGRTVLVVGDGAEAAAKVRLLFETEALVRLVAADPEPELAEMVHTPQVEHRARPFQ